MAPQSALLPRHSQTVLPAASESNAFLIRGKSFAHASSASCASCNHRLSLSAYVRRKGLQTARASTCVEERIAVQSEPLTKKDLVNHIAGGCKPKHMWRIGTEHEKFGFELGSLRPLSYAQVAKFLEGVARRYSWDKIIEEGHIFGLRKDGKSITLEVGGQVELSGVPLLNLYQSAAELESHFFEIKNVAQDMGIGFLGCGSHPKSPLDGIPILPKERFSIVFDSFSKLGSTGKEMGLNTSSVQVNLDFSSEVDMIKKFRVGLALQPIATALCANSPFTKGKPNGFVSYRSELYKDVDTRRTGIPSFVFDDNFGFERYVEYALSLPMIYAYRNQKNFNCHGMSFKDFIGGKLPNLIGDKATTADWQNHLMQIYTEVRLKTYLEMRGADVGCRKQVIALPALWVGLLYDETSLEGAVRMIEDWTPQECQYLRDKVTTLGLKTPFRGFTLKDVAQDVVKLAKEGLQRRGWEEVRFLDFFSEVANTGMAPAERLLNLYHGEWKGNVDNIFKELLC
ncbi:hypothetical protein L7F22_007651 [Adiantum nelumboides]|nr:hypothetical protein [Adiantum nelumboides]